MGLFQRQRHEPERRSGVCHTVGCERRVEPGVTFCASCSFDRLYRVVQSPDERAADHALDDWPTRPPTEFDLAAVTTPLPNLPNLYGLSDAERQRVAQEAWDAEMALSEEQSAPLIPDAEFDLCCRWCCYILAERTTARVRPTIMDWACAQHTARRAAHNAVRQHIDSLLARGVSPDGLAEYWRNGYLGDRLHDDDPM